MAGRLNARLTREVAEIAVIEYNEGIFLQDLTDVEGENKVAEAELALAEEVLKRPRTRDPTSRWLSSGRSWISSGPRLP